MITGDLLKFAGVRRRAILVGTGESLARLRRTLGASRGGIDYEFVGALSTSPDSAGLRPLGPPSSTAGRARGAPGRRADRHRLGLQRPRADGDRRAGAQARGEGARRPAGDGAPDRARGEYVPGQGVPLFELRPPVFVGADWLVKRGFDLVVSALVAIVGLAALGADRARDQARLARAGLLPRQPRRLERARVRDDQVPDDARRRRGRSRRSSSVATRPRARSSRSGTIRASRASARSCAASRSTRSRRC